MNIIVKELPRTLTEKELLQLFLPFGTVSAHNLVKEPGTGKSKGFGFVEMPDNLEAREAIKALHNKKIEDVRIRVKMISRKYEPTFKRPTRAKPEYTGPRSFGAITRTEEIGTERPERPGGRGTATSQSYRPRYEKTESQGTARPIRDRGPATPQRSSESRGTTGSGWTRSRAEAEGGRTGRTPDRGSTQPARTEGNYRSRPARPDSQSTDRPLRGKRPTRLGSDEKAKPIRGRGPATPKRAESRGGTGSTRTRRRTESQETAKPFMGARKAKRSRTPARPVKIGRSGARQNKSAKKGNK